MSYEQIYDDEWIEPPRKGFKLRCCDCALVHTVDFRLTGNRILMRWMRDERATSGGRRKKKTPKRSAVKK